MKITVPGATPLERLTNLTKRIVVVPKSEIDDQAKKYDEKKARRLKAKRRSH